MQCVSSALNGPNHLGLCAVQGDCEELCHAATSLFDSRRVVKFTCESCLAIVMVVMESCLAMTMMMELCLAMTMTMMIMTMMIMIMTMMGMIMMIMMVVSCKIESGGMRHA